MPVCEPDDPGGAGAGGGCGIGWGIGCGTDRDADCDPDWGADWGGDGGGLDGAGPEAGGAGLAPVGAEPAAERAADGGAAVPGAAAGRAVPSRGIPQKSAPRLPPEAVGAATDAAPGGRTADAPAAGAGRRTVGWATGWLTGLTGDGAAGVVAPAEDRDGSATVRRPLRFLDSALLATLRARAG